MNKKSIGIFLATTLLATVPMTFSPTFAKEAAPYQIAANMSDLIDVPEDHWAYNAVKVLVEELEIMMPKSSNMFKGNDLMTRGELAQVFYNAVQKMEGVSGKDLRNISDVPAVDMVDVDEESEEAINSVVNEYGIMQPMPGKKFMASEAISRYEVAFELYNYFVLIENNGVNPALTRRERSDELSDLPADHWATKAVTEVVDKYQVMDGYPDNTFRGGRRLTRYETAAVVREFIRYVDTYLLPLTPVPTPEPTAVPTPMPTAVPTPMPTPMPTAKPKLPFKPVDLRIGGDFKASYVDAQNTPGYIYGPNASLDWFFLPAGPTRLGIDLHGDWMFYDPFITPGQFKANMTDSTGAATTSVLNGRLTAGGGLVWRLLGAQSVEDFGLTLGAGYDYMMINGSNNYSYANHGPRGRVDIEIPVGPFFSIVGRDAFTYFIAPTAGVNDNYVWKNDAFLGLTIPAFTTFAVELGYKDTRYVKQDNPNAIFGDVGGELNLRFRF